MNGGTHMYALEGWTEVDCREADQIRATRHVEPGSSLTDSDGLFGVPVTYTEWWDENNDAVLRDYLWHPNGERRCEHFIPEGESE